MELSLLFLNGYQSKTREKLLVSGKSCKLYRFYIGDILSIVGNFNILLCTVENEGVT